MLPVDFPQRNHILNKPEGMSDEQCFSMYVCATHNSAGMPCIVSKWQLSKEDLEEIQKTGIVYLTIIGMTQPPVSLDTESPFV